MKPVIKSHFFSSFFTLTALIVCLVCQIVPVHAYCELQTVVASFNLTSAYQITTMISFILLLGYMTIVKKRETLFIFLYSAVFVINIGYTFLSSSTSISEALLANKISYLGAVFLPMFMLLIIAEESRIKIPRWIISVLIFISVLVYFLASSPGHSTLYYQSVELIVSDTGAYLVKDYGPLHLVYYGYLLFYFTSMAIVILYAYYTKKNTSLKLVLHLLACVSCNILIWFLGQIYHFHFEFLSVSYIITEAYLLSLYNMMEDFYEKEQHLTEHSMITMLIDSPESQDAHSMFESDGSINIDEIIRIWPQVAQLTPREIEVFQLLIQNKKRKDIAEELCVSENTVKKHTSNIFSKLNISNRTEIIKTISKIK